MRMAWWTFIFLLTIETLLIQYMVESYMAHHYSLLPYYVGAQALMLVTAWIMYRFFRKIEGSRE